MEKFQVIIKDDKPTLVDFFATWCGPCKTMAPILETLKEKVGDSATIIKIDVDKNEEIALHYKIQSIPTLILFKKGEILWRHSGVVAADQLKAIIDRHV
ncbi:MAG: thioredoxin [Bacteroidales bacterium]